MTKKKPDEKAEIVKGAQKPTRGRGGNSNFPNSKAGLIQTEDDRRFVAQLLSEVIVEYKQPRVKSDEELAARLDDYFNRCAASGQVPTVEEMAMCTGYSQSVVWDWETGRRSGFSDATAEIIRKAKHFLKTFDAKLAVSGKMNFLTYCFRAKNYYGMRDSTEHVVTPNVQNEDFDAESIKGRYLPPPSEEE